jgi:hypothetical protein
VGRSVGRSCVGEGTHYMCLKWDEYRGSVSLQLSVGVLSALSKVIECTLVSGFRWMVALCPPFRPETVRAQRLRFASEGDVCELSWELELRKR